MDIEHNQIDLCLSCCKEIIDQRDVCYTNFRYEVPGSGQGDKILVAVVCPVCAKDSDDPALFPVIEVLINTKVIRIENPSLLFTPK